MWLQVTELNLSSLTAGLVFSGGFFPRKLLIMIWFDRYSILRPMLSKSNNYHMWYLLTYLEIEKLFLKIEVWMLSISSGLQMPSIEIGMS